MTHSTHFNFINGYTSTEIGSSLYVKKSLQIPCHTLKMILPTDILLVIN